LDAETYTAAHLTLPFNSLVHVTNTDTNQTLLVRINDRGPFSDNNIIDLSKAAALELGMNLEHSFANVRVRYAGPADPMIAWFGDVASVPMETAPTQPFYEPFSEPVSEPFNVQTPTVEYSEPFMDLQTPEFFPVTPEALPVPPKEDDEFITLTIKGPIHMASAIMPSRKG